MPEIPSPVALTVAGFDPSSGAGITADLKTFHAHRVYGVACITAMTVQSTLGVRAVESQSVHLVQQTLACLEEDISFSGVKIGMLGSSAVAGVVSSFLSASPAGLSRSRIVLDPVIRSSSGAPLIDPAGIEVIRSRLLSQVGWVTPNLDELTILADGDAIAAGATHQVVSAARRLKDLAAGFGNDELNIVVTGGHMERPDDFLLTAGGGEFWFAGERVVTQATHGTGCAFSSALLCRLISGLDAEAAVAMAKVYVTQALRSAYPVGKGKGPMNHLFSLDLSGI